MALLQEGETIRGTYEVERMLGEGAFAEVYRVRHHFLGRQAMKVFKMVGMDLKEVEQLLEEAVLLSQIQHRNIIQIFEANTHSTSQGVCGFFTMEYVAGGSLEQFWRSHGTKFVPVETAVDILRQVCRGMVVAHGENPPIVHRDIKPQNILVGYDASGLRVRVSDFGLAKRVNPLSLIATTKGTFSFKPPEVFLEDKVDARRADVWAMGTTLYLILTDRLPIIEMSSIEQFDEECFEKPIDPPSRFNLQVDPYLDQIVMHALKRKPGERYPSAREMLADLEKWRPASQDKKAAVEAMDSQTSKHALGAQSPGVDDPAARTMAEQAIRLAREAQKLVEAADLMEEAFNKSPRLRDQYASLVKLWRQGIITPSTR